MLFSPQNYKTNLAGAKFPLIVSILDARGAETPPKKTKTPKTPNFDSKMTIRAFLGIIRNVSGTKGSYYSGTDVSYLRQVDVRQHRSIEQATVAARYDEL